MTEKRASLLLSSSSPAKKEARINDPFFQTFLSHRDKRAHTRINWTKIPANEHCLRAKKGKKRKGRNKELLFVQRDLIFFLSLFLFSSHALRARTHAAKHAPHYDIACLFVNFGGHFAVRPNRFASLLDFSLRCFSMSTKTNIGSMTTRFLPFRIRERRPRWIETSLFLESNTFGLNEEATVFSSLLRD